MKFNKNNLEHVRCVRDIEMEIRYGNKCCPFDDGYNDVRQYVRNVLINKIEKDADITDLYEQITGMIKYIYDQQTKKM